MNHAEFKQWLDTAIRRKLSPDEEKRLEDRLAEDPSAKAAWEEEMALNRLLNRLPDAPLASNFTAQVLRAIARDARPRRSRAPMLFRWLGLRRPAWRLAAAGLALGLAGLAQFQYQSIRRERMAVALTSVAGKLDTVSDLTSLPSVEVWGDFEAINRLSQTQPQADEQLLAVLEVAAP